MSLSGNHDVKVGQFTSEIQKIGVYDTHSK